MAKGEQKILLYGFRTKIYSRPYATVGILICQLQAFGRARHALFCDLRTLFWTFNFALLLSRCLARPLLAFRFRSLVFRARNFALQVSFRTRESIFIYNKERKANTGKVRQDKQNRKGGTGQVEQDRHYGQVE